MVQYRRLAVGLVGAMVMLTTACLTTLSLSCADQQNARAAIEQRFSALTVLDPNMIIGEHQRSSLIDFCQQYNINRLLVRVESASSDQQGHQPTIDHAQDLAKLIAQARKKRIAVEALIGSPGMALEENREQTLTLLEGIVVFNRTLPTDGRLLGVHLDISPHLLPSWDQPSRRREIMRQYVEMLEIFRTHLKQNSPRLTLAATMPSWYDEKVAHEDNCTVDYFGQHRNLHKYIQDLTDYVVVLCDRPREGDTLGITDRVASELSYAQWIGKSLWVGFKTQKNPRYPRTTFYGRPAREFWLQRKQVELTLKHETSFGGAVVSDYSSFRQLLAQQNNPAQQKSILATRVFGMWVWRDKWFRTEQAQDEVLAFCEAYGIDMLPVQVPIDRSSIKRGRPQLLYADQLRRFIQKANSKGIQIEMLDGAPEMALAQNRQVTLAVLDAIFAFNKTLPANTRIAGIHYDIEPYLLPQWDTPQRREIMRQNLDLYEAVALKIKLDAPWMTLSASIPFWYDQKIAPDDNCTLEYNGQSKNFHEHIQDMTDYVAIMSYRRQALGDDSIAQHIEVERAYAEWVGKYVCAGLETLKIPGRPEVSFHGLPPSEFWFQKQKLEQALSKRGGFGGVIVHSYETFAPYLVGSNASTN